MNNKGQMIMVNLLIFVMVIFVAVAMIPVLKDVLETAQGSNALNCQGYIDDDATESNNYTYNATLNSEGLACTAIDLYLPYILLVVLVGGVSGILMRRQDSGFDQGGF